MVGKNEFITVESSSRKYHNFLIDATYINCFPTFPSSKLMARNAEKNLSQLNRLWLAQQAAGTIFIPIDM